MAAIGYIAVDRYGLPIRTSNGGGGNHAASAKLYSTASTARGALSAIYGLRGRTLRAARVRPVEAKQRVTKFDTVVGFCLMGPDGRLVSSGHRTRLYTALGFARKGARAFGGDVRYVVITSP